MSGENDKTKDNPNLYRAKKGLILDRATKPIEDMDRFKDNQEYIEKGIYIFLEMIEDVQNLLELPDLYRRDQLAKKYSSKLSQLEKVRLESEKKLGKFISTEFFESLGMDEEEKTIVFLLLAKNGLGVQVDKPTLSGEEIIICLHALHQTSVTEARGYLMKSSNLVERKIIGNPGMYPEDAEIEKMKFGIGEYAISKMLGETERSERIASYYDNAKETSSSSPSLTNLSSVKENDGNQILEPLDEEVDPEEVVLPAELKKSVLATVNQLAEQDKFSEWMGEVIEGGSGLNLLFTGPSGVGKSYFSKALGTHLSKDVYYLPLDNLLSHWFGKTEKKAQKVFERIDEEQAIVIIDEADGILKRRSSSNGPVVSTENRIVDIFLRGMENHNGILIFTTNYSIALDSALSRRFDLKVKFPRPDYEARKKIWDHHLPDSLPLADDINIERLAQKYDLTGGEIKNAVLYAARIAISESREKVCQEDLVNGVESEKENAMDYSLHSDGDGLDNSRGFGIYG